GDMFSYLRRVTKFNEKQAKFYAAQIYLVFEYLHYFDILYRDLKPENILISENGYLKVTDFGFAKHVSGRTYTLCGTPDYLPPEIIKHKGYAKSVDWWTFGILAFEMVGGQPPFSGKDHIQLYEAIVNQRFTSPNYFSVELTDMIRKLLVVDVSTRLGCMANGNKDIQSHSWFDNINFARIYHQQEQPQYKYVFFINIFKLITVLEMFFFLVRPPRKDPLDPSTLNHAEEPVRVSRHHLHEEEFKGF
ncbi:unnamed protein product, partial [Didymodactylos carnosus]